MAGCCVRRGGRHSALVLRPPPYAHTGGIPTGDGKADILWRHATTGDVSLWLMNGPTPLSKTVVATMSTDVTLSVYRMQ